MFGLEKNNIEPKFIEQNQLSYEQLTDPDYANKEIQRMNNGLKMTCSKCHHCR